MTVPARRPVDDALYRLERELPISGACGCKQCESHKAALATVRQELQRLREERDAAQDALQSLAADHYFARAEAAEAEVRRLTEGLRELESAVRILGVMLREPAAKGLMSAEDYRTYLQGAWLGVDEAAEKARALLAASSLSPGDTGPDGGGAK